MTKLQNSKPRIGFTTRDFPFDFLRFAIAVSIWLAGGAPVRLHPKNPKYDEKIDGLVIGGGTDLHPPLYKNDPRPNYRYDLARDELEVSWLRRAEEEGLPVLGICRGAQLLNVSRGGSLHVDVSKVYENAKYPASLLANIFFRKKVELKAGSKLQSILGVKSLAVNSMHKQAIDDLGDKLEVSAKEANGVVQAVEDPSKEFFMGVQFHPEALIHRSKFRAIFKALVKAAKPQAQAQA